MEKTRTLKVTLEIPVRAMSEDEWQDANEGCVFDDEDEGPGREETLAEVQAKDFIEAISAATNSANNPEIFAGTGLFVHMEDATVKSIEFAA
ncbi:MAG: hypothetical protein RLW68_00970 [Devosia marina]|uniref:hypothetical protein n=1 Tax=Devosia marina TaxID=2683198 RepID=UPI0032EAF995